ncbi:MAG: hypothetical protein RSA21_00570, partial [Akkermansia sp.]
ILYNGKCVASWLAKIPVDLTITNMRKITIMKLKIDDWERRFKWVEQEFFCKFSMKKSLLDSVPECWKISIANQTENQRCLSFPQY